MSEQVYIVFNSSESGWKTSYCVRFSAAAFSLLDSPKEINISEINSVLTISAADIDSVNRKKMNSRSASFWPKRTGIETGKKYYGEFENEKLYFNLNQ